MAPIAISESNPIEAADAIVALKAANDTRLPVTILSGFLGSGKTTLLTWILQNKDHQLRVAVIVNDIGALNIDAALIKNHNVLQKEEKIVQMENGCICCTLRGDLLEEVARLAESKSFDYLVIESTGVSEPQQVAESFAPEFAEMHIQAAEDLRAEADRVKREAKQRAAEKKGETLDSAEDVEMPDVANTLKLAEILGAGGLPKVARLDTCVTVVDACSLLSNFNTSDFLSDRQEPGTVDEQDERNISDLMVDQLEFADAIIINKTDMVDATTLAKIKSLVRTLNPDADIMTAIRCRVDLKRILDTKRFSFEKSMMSAGWLKSLREEVLPETIEYGISTFVYKARRPFHPERLWLAVRNRFVVIQDSYQDMLDGLQVSHEGNDVQMSDAESEYETESEEGEETDDEDQPQLDPVARLKSKQADPAFGPLLRSKGFFWLATRPMMSGELSQAGVMLTIGGGSRWMCEVDESDWPEDDDMRDKIRKDFKGDWGDRRQELVMIGEDMPTIQPLLTQVFDECLLNDVEWSAWKKIMKGRGSMKRKIAKLQELFEDGWEDWLDQDDPQVMELMGGHEGHTH